MIPGPHGPRLSEVALGVRASSRVGIRSSRAAPVNISSFVLV